MPPTTVQPGPIVAPGAPAMERPGHPVTAPRRVRPRVALEEGSDPDLLRLAVVERASAPSDPPGLLLFQDELREQLQQEEARVARCEEREKELAGEFQVFEREVAHSVHEFRHDGMQFLRREQQYNARLRAQETTAIRTHEQTLQQLDAERTQQAQAHHQQLFRVQAEEARRQQQALDQQHRGHECRPQSVSILAQGCTCARVVPPWAFAATRAGSRPLFFLTALGCGLPVPSTPRVVFVSVAPPLGLAGYRGLQPSSPRFRDAAMVWS